LARIFEYGRVGGRCPICDFLDELESRMLNRFKGQFDALSKTGAGYCNHERFRPLRGEGKPLWEFKEHDHRMYCHRQVVQNTQIVHVVLLNGWVKEKKGKTEKEDREIAKAKSLCQEFLDEYPGGNICTSG
jgi:hypothetical protein